MKVATAVYLFILFFQATMKIALTENLPAEVTVCLLSPDGAALPPEKVPSVRKSDEDWLKQLGPERFRILRTQGTERPFCGTLLDNKKTGIYFCAGCELPLFSSKTKFHSGTGWPSFFEPFARENVIEIQDRSHGMLRTEIRCARCDGHLGHVFPDGPPPTGLRYCLNSEALSFRETSER
ncbi:MAG TPA: peptide-methionine (R)-S-oxide reductase MsrB [Terrimicrobiaceae bacterium]